MRSSLAIIFIFLIITILPDFIIYKEWIRQSNKIWLKKANLAISAFFILGIISLLLFLPKIKDDFFLEIFIWFNWLLLTIYIPKLLLTLFLLFNKLVTLLIHQRARWITKTGGILAILFFLGFLYGAFIGRFDVEVKRVEIRDSNLPAAFEGLKIVQISDLHVGSLSEKTAYWEKAVAMINAQQPDLIMMTGDMIDNFASELTPRTLTTLTKMKAGIAKYAILGNHDYGDYSQWHSPEMKRANLDALIRKEWQMGFRLLLDQHDLLVRGTDTLVVAGVQNWSKPPFHCYGNLPKAIAGTEHHPYILLLSHDPNHWMAQVVKYPNIRLTLAGHTHGMQLGINILGIHWSPAQWIFKQWDGLYFYNNKALYVNRGLGYIGIPLRLGMPPEITVITLRR